MTKIRLSTPQPELLYTGTPPIKAQHTSRDDVREIEYSLGESRQESEMNESKALTTICSVCFCTYVYIVLCIY